MKPEKKYFRKNNELLKKMSQKQRKGTGKKIGAPLLIDIEKE